METGVEQRSVFGNLGQEASRERWKSFPADDLPYQNLSPHHAFEFSQLGKIEVESREREGPPNCAVLFVAMENGTGARNSLYFQKDSNKPLRFKVLAGKSGQAQWNQMGSCKLRRIK